MQGSDLRSSRAVPDRSTTTGRGRRRVWVTVAAVAMVTAALVVAVPRLVSRAPTARGAVQLAPFDGLMTPWVLRAAPAGLRAVGLEGRQGSTTAAYVTPHPGPDRVYVGHTAAAPEDNSADVPGARALRRQADGSWVLVAGYGSFASDAVVAALLAAARPAPEAATLQVDLAPAGWQLAAFADLEPDDGGVTLTPSGDDSGGADAITITRYRAPVADFPAGYQGEGPVLRPVSIGRPGILRQGNEFWTLQLRLADGGALVLTLPVRMTREQVQRFVDGVTTPNG